MRSEEPAAVRLIGFALILFAIAFNLPYLWLASNFDYPAILRRPAGAILEAFSAGGDPLVLAWAAFALAALVLAPIAVGIAAVTRGPGHASSPLAGLGIAAGVTQAIGLSRWVYAVPGLASAWTASGETLADAPPSRPPSPPFTSLRGLESAKRSGSRSPHSG